MLHPSSGCNIMNKQFNTPFWGYNLTISRTASANKVHGLDQVLPNSHLTSLKQQHSNFLNVIVIFFSAWFLFDKKSHLRRKKTEIPEVCHSFCVNYLRKIFTITCVRTMSRDPRFSPEMKELGSGWRERNWLT